MRLSSSIHQYLFLRLVFIPCLVLLLLPLLAWSSDRASTVASAAKAQGMQETQETLKWFGETGKTIRGKFLDYWNKNGGLAQQGFPITEEMQEKSDTDGRIYTVQYFERAVFEKHPENQPPYDVLLQLLGVLRYKQQYAGPGGAATQKANIEPGAQKFPQTGKTVGGRFLGYWRDMGGLSQFGYPISDEFQEKSALDGKTYTVQYFERAVFELHPENKSPYDVLLSQLGTFRQQTIASQEKQKPVIPEFRSEIPDGQYLPLYPGAVMKSVIDSSYAERFVRYDALAEADTVRAFYRDTLPRYGWALIYTDDVNSYLGRYSWTDPQKAVPWHLSLSVQVTGNPGSSQSQVRLIYKRYPDLDKTPLYPGATEVTVTTGHGGIGSHCPGTVTTTTFLTASAAGEVENFYKNALPSYGWVPIEPLASIVSSEGMLFTSVHEVGYRPGRVPVWTDQKLNLTINAQQGSGGLTKITLALLMCEFDSSAP